MDETVGRLCSLVALKNCHVPDVVAAAPFPTVYLIGLR